MNNLSGNKKILISIAAFILALGVLVGGLFILSNKNDQTTPADPLHTYSSEAEVVSKGDGTTSAPVTNSPVMNIKIDATESEQIEAYVSGRYYMSSVMYADGVATDMDIAISGQNFHTTTTIEGMKMGIMFLNNKVYVINNNEKKYIDFDSISALVGVDMGFDMSELKEVTAALDLTKYNFHSFEQSEVDLNGESANCYKYYSDEVSISFYFVDGAFKQIDYGNANGDVATTVNINYFSPTIPSDMLSLKGLRQSTIFDFFGDEILQQMQ